MEDWEFLEREIEDEDDKVDLNQIMQILNTTLFKVDSLEMMEPSIILLRELDEKVTDNMRRLNEMIKEFKGLVAIVRGEQAVKK